MKKTVIGVMTIFLVIFMILSVIAEDCEGTVFAVDDLFGIKKNSNEILVQPEYLSIEKVLCDNAFFYICTKEQGTQLLNSDGQPLLNGRCFTDVWVIDESRFTLFDENKEGIYYPAKGGLYIEPEWDMITNEEQYPEKGWCYIYSEGEGLFVNGEVVIPPEYMEIVQWINDNNGQITFIAVPEDGPSKRFSLNGTCIEESDMAYRKVGDFPEHMLYMRYVDEESPVDYVLVDTESNSIVWTHDANELSLIGHHSGPYYELYAKKPRDATCEIEYNGNTGFISSDGEIITSNEWGTIYGFSECDRSFVRLTNGKLKLIDLKGEYVSDREWYEAGSQLHWYNDFDFVFNGNHWVSPVKDSDDQDVYFIDMNGNTVDFEYSPVKQGKSDSRYVTSKGMEEASNIVDSWEEALNGEFRELRLGDGYKRAMESSSQPFEVILEGRGWKETESTVLGIDETGRVMYIQCGDFDFDGIRPGNDVSEVIERFGEPTEWGGNNTNRMLYYGYTITPDRGKTIVETWFDSSWKLVNVILWLGF